VSSEETKALDGKTAFVTGAGSGIGREIALTLAGAGARVCVTDIDVDAAATVAAQCAGGAFSAVCDVAESASVEKAFAALDAAAAGVDILVNNAGIINADPEYIRAFSETSQAQLAETLAGSEVTTHFDTIERIDDAAFDRMLKIHLYGTFYCTRAALPRMRAAGRGGRIINIGSIMGSASHLGAPDYCAAKGGIMAFTRATAREAASYGVLVNTIAPGYIDTPLLDPIEEGQRAMIRMQTPLARLGEAREIAATALFLAGPGGSFFTGQSLSPNGGIYMSQ
jgi:3-oxoacyl-[acyl-carrier protein] reductase